ncbi:hypothetical protein PENTCL1PPCAC_702, partial [Pristionchus entomophagus]
SECSRCENPFENFNAKFSTNWNQCSEFNCGANSRMIFEFYDSKQKTSLMTPCVSTKTKLPHGNGKKHIFNQSLLVRNISASD